MHFLFDAVKMPAPKRVISPIVDVTIQLVAADDVIKGAGRPNRGRPGKAPFSRLNDDDLKRVEKRARSMLNDKGMLMYLFYGGCSNDACIAGMTVLQKPLLSSPSRGCFNFSLTVSYSLTKPMTAAQLRKEVDGIFSHWKWSGDVTYRLLSFSVNPDAGVYTNITPEGNPLYSCA
tara:strand:- start:1327 stop:1851 length:525 start_codon:yes stop_codon:yes gene_type:complete